jgi:tyrosine-protein kinase
MNPEPLGLRDHLSVIRRRKGIVLAVAATTTAAALFYSYRQTPVYTSSAEVVVRPVTFDPGQSSLAREPLNMATEEQLASSGDVASLALSNLADEGVEPGSLSTEQVEDTETLMFTSVSPFPEAAQATANAYANAYLRVRLERVLSELTAARQPYEEQRDAITAELRSIVELLPDVESDSERLLLTARYSALLAQRSALTASLNDLVTPENVQVGSILQTAQLASSPSGLSHTAFGIIGLMVGLALGVGVALFAERVDDRVRGPEELELSLGAPVLGYIPRRAKERGPPVTLSDPTSDAAESYKALRVMLLHVAAQRDLKSLIITSSLEGEGKTATTANLGVAMALAGNRVVIVSADLRRPALESYFPAREEAGGLIQVLRGKRKPLDGLSRVSEVQDLWVLHAGNVVSSLSPLELLGSESMSQLMAELRNFADFVLIDTTPLLVSRDVSAMAALTDGVLFVVNPNLAQRPTIQQALHELQLVGPSIIGVVVNKYNPRRFSAFPGYGYQYSYNGREQRVDQVPD